MKHLVNGDIQVLEIGGQHYRERLESYYLPTNENPYWVFNFISGRCIKTTCEVMLSLKKRG